MAKAIGFNVFERQRGLHLKLPNYWASRDKRRAGERVFALLRKT